MERSTQHARGGTERSAACSAIRAEIGQFQRALDAIAGQQPNDEESVLDALIDFLGCRCRNIQQRKLLAAGLFDALHNESSCSVNTGMFGEQFTFRSAQGSVDILVEQQQIAEISAEIADRLTTLLHGARHSTEDQKCAA